MTSSTGSVRSKRLFDLSFVEEFETCKNLITMMDAGLIESTATVSVKKEKGKGSPGRLTRHLADFGTVLAVGIVALVVFFQLAVIRMPNFPWSQEERRGWGIFQSSLEKLRESRVTQAREVFFLEENRYPAENTEMVKRGLLSR